jgi:hypothetical protein
MDTRLTRIEDRMFVPERPDSPPRGLSANQWVALIVMGGMLLAIGAALVLVLRSGELASVDVLATAIAGPTPTSTPPPLVPDAVATPSGLYWPPQPQPLATPNAPSNLMWWDAQFAYRRPILLDSVAAEAPAGTWARLLFDGERAEQEGKMRSDGNDLCVLVWDGAHWWEIPRWAQPRLDKRGWEVLFHLQDREVARSGYYYLYYGNPHAGPPPALEQAPEPSRLLLAVGDRESVEWGPEITWTANSTTTQTLVSPDGRIVIQRPPGGLAEDVHVRLRTVPATAEGGPGSLLRYELHVDPPPGPPGPSKVVHWNPPLTVVLNWAGLPVSLVDLESWTHFVYDEDMGAWYSLSVEFDRERGTIRMQTDQP